MEIPLEKILTVSTRDYCEIKPVGDYTRYEMIGVHVELHSEADSDAAIKESLIKLFAKNVPENAEVIVDYRTSLAGNHNCSGSTKHFFGTASGTALVLKPRGPPPTEEEIKAALRRYDG